MPKLTSTASDKVKGDAIDTSAGLMPNITITTDPVVITAVQRKANIGNYETIDIYSAVAMPLNGALALSGEELAEVLEKVADAGFAFTSKATLDRYKIVKDSIKKN